MTQERALRDEVAEAGRVLAALGLVTAFGHVSARAGDAMLITPAADLGEVTADRVVRVPLDAAAGPAGTPAGMAPEMAAGAPAEAWAHLALYRRRGDVAAVARAQPPSAFPAGAAVRAGAAIEPLYGQAAWLGERIPVHDDARLLRSMALAEAAAARLPDGEALLLRGNGAITLGATPGLAVARMWLLAAACQAFLTARAGGPVTPLSGPEIASWRAVSGELLPRLWHHLRRRAHEQRHGYDDAGGNG